METVLNFESYTLFVSFADLMSFIYPSVSDKASTLHFSRLLGISFQTDSNNVFEDSVSHPNAPINQFIFLYLINKDLIRGFTNIKMYIMSKVFLTYESNNLIFFKKDLNFSDLKLQVAHAVIAALQIFSSLKLTPGSPVWSFWMHAF